MKNFACFLVVCYKDGQKCTKAAIYKLLCFKFGSMTFHNLKSSSSLKEGSSSKGQGERNPTKNKVNILC